MAFARMPVATAGLARECHRGAARVLKLTLLEFGL